MLLTESGPVFGPSGAPSLRMTFVPIDQVEVLDTWDVTGLRGTGSHDILYPDIFVPAARVTDPLAPRARRLDPIGAIPIRSRLGGHLTAVAIGSTWHAIEELKALAGAKTNFGTASLIRDRADVQIAVSRASGLIEAARATLTSVSTEILTRVLEGGQPELADLAHLRLSCATASTLCVDAIDLIHAAAGTSTLASDSVIGLCWRDVHAVSQHVSQQSKHYENVGRVMLGLAPNGPI